MIVPAYLPYYIIPGTAGMTAAILLGLGSALHNAGWAATERAAAVRLVAFIVLGWLVLTSALALNDAYRGAADHLPTIQYGIVLPILIGGLWIWRSPRLARIIDAVPQHWLVGVQLYRVLGAIFLVLNGTGKLPGLFAWPAGLGDVLVGVLAPVVATAHARDPHKNADLVLTWNLFGLVDLLVAVTTGFLTSPSPLQLFAYDAPNELISAFPLVLVPVYLVPVSVLLHIASLTKLRRDVSQHDERKEIARAPA
jgi:hypothetical protein